MDAIFTVISILLIIAVARWMWAAWQEQSERIADMAAALDRSHNRSTGLLQNLNLSQAMEIQRLK